MTWSSKKELLVDVWHQAWGGSDKTVDVHLSWLRRKLGESAAEPRYLHTVRGVGVRLSAAGRREHAVRRSLILTVAAAVAMVLLAMLVPMAILLRDYALEDRLATAALEVQATETVVSGAGDDDGDVAVYVARINADSDTLTTVLYPGNRTDVGPQPGEDDRVLAGPRRPAGRASTTWTAAPQILVPVSLGGASGRAATTPGRPGLRAASRA